MVSLSNPLVPIAVLASPQRLSNKIIRMLMVFFLCAITVIGATLLISWQLEGGAAAINDAGSQRMRSYRIGHLMGQGLQEADKSGRFASDIRSEMELFEKVLQDLEQGDPGRPLSPPREVAVYQGIQAVKGEWASTIKPVLSAYLQTGDRGARRAALERYDHELAGFVAKINELVLRMEGNYAFHANLLRSCQLGLAVLAVIGTGVLIRFFSGLVIRPVGLLHDGIRRMAGGDLAVRLPVDTQDEFGVLASGFNRMALHLQEVHSTLEERVETETRRLADRNRELAMLYEIAACLNEPESLDELCSAFLQRLKNNLGARAGAVRLYAGESRELFMHAHDGLSKDFITNELALPCGLCLCGDAMQRGISMQADTSQPPPGMVLKNCVREGFRTASAFTIGHGKQTLGVFNLYFDEPRQFSDRETHLLETLGQHLGVAVENQRLRARERELAVSEERNLLAQELHDSIAQGLAFLNIQVQLLQDSLKKPDVAEALETAAHIREGVQTSYEDVRELLVHFRTRVTHADLDSTLLAVLEKFEAQTGISTEFDRTGSGLPLGPEDQIQVLHIVQESLSNIRKHAQATAVRLELERGIDGLVVEVSDNGVGFDPANNPAVASDRHVGLKIMEERARRIGGECLVTSAAGKGTRVTLSLPRLQRETA